MTIRPGTLLGPYEIVASIGAGGMGEVWRAKDTRLDREVAIKILPPGLAQNEQFLQRFDREAKAISQLNHPNVCTLYDVGSSPLLSGRGARGEGASESGDTPSPGASRATLSPGGEGTELHYLVMELLEGESLADRVKKGPLPLPEVLKFGRQVASALDAAHRQGITHRDLKPGNVMLTKAGAKLLDFGLAKTAREGQSPIDGLTNMPTEAKPLTTEGTILGTFQYMAPEQLEGLEADARTDIFALGAVLYEMATGRRAFQGQSKTSLIAAIVSSQPEPISSVVAMAPPALDHVVRKCLEKDPDDRWQSAHDVASELQWISEAGSQAGVAVGITVRRKTREKLAWSLAGLLGVIAIATTVLWTRSAKAPDRTYRFTIPVSTTEYRSAGAASISPDGSRIAFGARDAGGAFTLRIRGLDSFESRVIEGTADYANQGHFWSPDGKMIAYWNGRNLVSVDVDGGSPRVVTSVPDGITGGDWSRDGVILFARNRSGIWRVPATGGTPTEITKLDPAHSEKGDVFPTFLPDGRRFLFVATTFDAKQPNQIHRLYAGSLDSSETRFIGEVTSRVRYVEPGFLLTARNGTLVALPFDPKKLTIIGEPVSVVDDVECFLPVAMATFEVSTSGTIVYSPPPRNERLVWIDRMGNELGQIGEIARFYDLRISPDGADAAIAIADPATGTPDIWRYGLTRQTVRRVTIDPRAEFAPVWTGGGQQMVFAGAYDGWPDIYRLDLDGSGASERILSKDGYQAPRDISPDGRSLLYEDDSGGTGSDLWILPLDAENAESRPFLASPFNEADARFSPNGQWIAYDSDESGRVEVYVKPFPGPGPAIQISTAEGELPAWSKDGRALYYRSRDPVSKRLNRLEMVELASPADFANPRSTLLFDLKDQIDFFDVAPDGRFLVSARDESRRPENHVIVNALAGLAKR